MVGRYREIISEILAVAGGAPLGLLVGSMVAPTGESMAIGVKDMLDAGVNWSKFSASVTLQSAE